ncbi:putative vacuolar proton translocating ATPase 116 kDa subunit A [Gregarina niphandrodes]|uniref:V-type proton ATPase subunit a n=1 Tax=Gregarina niphandrodes TaxID=110365 RepID=A0A023AYB7_GRENI|nr:putative vacuolar proton translocating ATPase 116 kDa subunit A [Gregarina niphandrodes]EZG43423.1 putative vacuolar proton translocating ATPase 116 kDa subunit A [Gregarina niphandrodes]|eukprot:XP_011133343.1 putative vacuolar proton translocating ATPase 116 kDa subunit A [Gregarina niphandrodes]
MGILRSEQMQHGTLVIPTERAVEIISLLGQKGEVMIQDMNATSMKRPYRRYIQRIEEMERQLRYLMTEIQKLPGAKVVTGDVNNFLDYDGFVLEGVEESLSTLTDQFVKFRANNDDLLRQRTRAMMERAVAKVAAKSLDGKHENLVNNAGTNNAAGLLAADAEAGAANGSPVLSSFAGVVRQEDVSKLSRTLFRATRGNAFTYYEAIDEDDNGQFVDEAAADVAPVRNVFVVYYPGGPGSAMHEKIERICKAFGIDTFEWPRSADEARDKIGGLTEVIDDKTRALEAFEEFFFDEVAVLLQPVHAGGNSLIEDWRLYCMKQKATYACLNLFEETESTLRADCWYPANTEDHIRGLLKDFSSGVNVVSAFLLSDTKSAAASGGHGGLDKNPPTYNKTNQFTECFQEMVDTYGVPRYQEVNPALFSTVTFPFMFGVMYGDIGHGILVTLFALVLIAYNKQLVRGGDELAMMVSFGRYMILMMGCFAIYSGIIYNDFFALGFNLYGSRYVINPVSTAAATDGTVHYMPNRDQDKSMSDIVDDLDNTKKSSGTFPYPFGIDPIWKSADNELDFLNSYKMKLSVIFGFVQMLLGTLLKGLNSIYFRDHLTLWFEFLPQFIFMLAFVGYMDLLIILKWAQSYYGQPRTSIITTVINMAMLKEVTKDDEYFPNQQTVERVLLIILVVCIPWMLICKPVLAKMAWNRHHKSAVGTKTANNQEERILLENEHDNAAAEIIIDQSAEVGHQLAEQNTEEEGEEFNFGEEFIHQTIETIEFVLGSISNTASYLRLWALSLAHQQLAAVFFEQILLNIIKAVVKPDGGIGNTIVGGICIFLGFGAFAAVTFGIMLCMDTLECYLHALRLHWVEFQNKFYKADGYKFVPFSYFRILNGLDAE